MPNRLEAPLIKNPDEFEVKLPECRQWKLRNDIPVYSIRGGAEDVMKVEWILSAGNYFENKTGIASAVSRLLKSGTSDKTAFEVNQYFEYHGAFLTTASYNEYAMVRLETLSRHFRKLLPLVAKLFTDVVFPEEEVQLYKQNTLQQLEVNLKRCEFVANREVDTMLYGENHPYGRKTNPDDIRSMEREDIVDFYKRFYQETDCMIFASGNLPADFEELLNRYFGDLPVRLGKTDPALVRKPAATKKVYIENDQQAVQSAIRIAREFPVRTHPDFKKALVLNVLLGGYFGSRLMSNIREDKGYTYGIYSYIQSYPRYASWIITTEAGKAVKNQTIEEIYKELSRLRRESAGYEELRVVKNYLMGQQLASLDGPFNSIDRWKGLVLNGLDASFFYETIDVIRKVTGDELQEIAGKYFVPEDFYELVVE